MVAKTSINAYLNITFSGKRNEQERAVIRAVYKSKNGLTRAEIAKKLGIDPSTVGARVRWILDNYKALKEEPDNIRYCRAKKSGVRVKVVEFNHGLFE